jgi:tetratricopeptide (TPR) repeat protein
MAHRKSIVLASWGCALGLLAGCAGKTPSASHQQAVARYSADGSTLMDSTASNSAVATAPPSTPAQMAKSIGSSVTETVQSVGHKIADAFEIEPRVIPADDPASLAQMPKNLSPSIYIQSAIWSERNGNPETARQQYEKGIELSPRDMATLVHYARFLDRQNRADEAVAIYQRALSIEPRNVVALNDLGLCHARQGRFQLALVPLRDAVAAAPENARYRNNLANVLVAAGQTPAAVETLQQIHPPAIAHYNVGCLLVRHRKMDEAARHLAYSIQLDPNFPSSHEMLAQVNDQLRIAANSQPRSLPPTF